MAKTLSQDSGIALPKTRAKPKRKMGQILRAWGKTAIKVAAPIGIVAAFSAAGVAVVKGQPRFMTYEVENPNNHCSQFIGRDAQGNLFERTPHREIRDTGTLFGAYLMKMGNDKKATRPMTATEINNSCHGPKV